MFRISLIVNATNNAYSKGLIKSIIDHKIPVTEIFLRNTENITLDTINKYNEIVTSNKSLIDSTPIRCELEIPDTCFFINKLELPEIVIKKNAISFISLNKSQKEFEKPSNNIMVLADFYRMFKDTKNTTLFLLDTKKHTYNVNNNIIYIPESPFITRIHYTSYKTNSKKERVFVEKHYYIKESDTLITKKDFTEAN